MPASHDAGMSVLNGHTGGANEQNTVTQNLDIGGQLNSGARYFDIRPVIASGGFATGHYSDVSGVWQGGNGQSIDDIISRINSFLDRNQELVILSLSHTLDTDNGYQKFSQGQWNQLLWKLSGLKYRYVAPAGTSDLSKLKLRDFIGAGPKVLLILDGDAAKLSWTLTQQGGTSFGIVGKSIIDLAEQVFPNLFNKDSLWDAMSKRTYPNFIMIDAWPDDKRLTALVVAINEFLASGC